MEDSKLKKKYEKRTDCEINAQRRRYRKDNKGPINSLDMCAEGKSRSSFKKIANWEITKLRGKKGQKIYWNEKG